MPAPKEHPAVDAEIREAAPWYEDRCPGLGDEFIEAVRRAVRAAARVPLRHAVRFADIRRLKLRRFPYSVWFFLHGETVYVLTVLHNKRDHRAVMARRIEV